LWGSLRSIWGGPVGELRNVKHLTILERKTQKRGKQAVVPHGDNGQNRKKRGVKNVDIFKKKNLDY